MLFHIVHQNPSDTDSPPNTETHQHITHSKWNKKIYSYILYSRHSKSPHCIYDSVGPVTGHNVHRVTTCFWWGKRKRAEYRESLFTLSASRGSCRPSGVHQSVCKLTLKPVTPEFINSFLNRLISVLVQFKVSNIYRQTADTLLVCTCQSQRLF